MIEKIDHNILTNNRDHWINEMGYKSNYPKAWNVFKSIPVSHTFGFERIIFDEIGNKHKISFEDILFENKALLSSEEKLKKHEWFQNDYDAIPEIDKFFELQKYVYAYFGTHESYYVNKFQDPTVPAFGVFIEVKNGLSFVELNATRRDLSYKYDEAKHAFMAMKEFLYPHDALEISLLQAYNDNPEINHNGDFWHYYGATDYFINQEYRKNSWRWKTEYHFFERVACSDFKAIMWPLVPRINTEDIAFIVKFQKTFQKCAVLPYLSSPKDAYKNFRIKSYEFSQFFSINKEWPDFKELLKEISK